MDFVASGPRLGCCAMIATRRRDVWAVADRVGLRLGAVDVELLGRVETLLEIGAPVLVCGGDWPLAWDMSLRDVEM